MISEWLISVRLKRELGYSRAAAPTGKSSHTNNERNEPEEERLRFKLTCISTHRVPMFAIMSLSRDEGGGVECTDPVTAARAAAWALCTGCSCSCSDGKLLSQATPLELRKHNML